MVINIRYQYLLFNNITNNKSSAADMFRSWLRFLIFTLVLSKCVPTFVPKRHKSFSVETNYQSVPAVQQ